MEFSISVRLNLKKLSNHIELENLIYEIGYNCNASNIYSDYNLYGVNNYIKSNFKIIIIELNSIELLLNFMKLMNDFNKVEIEYIYDKNEIVYADKKYLYSLEMIQNKDILLDKIEKNAKLIKYKKIYNLINQKSK